MKAKMIDIECPFCSFKYKMKTPAEFRTFICIKCNSYYSISEKGDEVTAIYKKGKGLIY
jgi:endogenous inhibitor of DNA gyrase (YacG/DUF329 family)